MNDDVTLSYYNVFFVIIYYTMSIFVLIVLFKLRGYVKIYIQAVVFTVILLVFTVIQYNILLNGGVLIYIYPHYFSIYDYSSIRFGALFFFIVYCCLMPVSKFDREEREKQSGNDGEKNE
ncbi:MULTISPECIES: hypothetical protein [Photorhabdus]|uniref:Uncharacterized protein n=3 Tax=Photorhabdus TaxID=29487 RepID=A0A329X9K0_9GAMM|nr:MULTISPECIES: hypothetical protein [Photorhabdus]NDK99984.1 hypothetical protein [Photorhabdus bodei]NDL03053.1 hypothetical protein [Photorhabdus bodei]NDL08227.1 hypothetical protein [Photorhabdus bodei]OCA54848.1 hypothetical protein Phpb_02196 [Photorhabdus namnaonensis]RAW90816.1 hypothetical protein CKY01_11465 [Photorhabdus laumondii subsp. clarkei]